jgi:hypothetical protein
VTTTPTSDHRCEHCGQFHYSSLGCQFASGVAYHAGLLRQDLARLVAVRVGCPEQAGTNRDLSEHAVITGARRRIAMIRAQLTDIEERHLDCRIDPKDIR